MSFQRKKREIEFTNQVKERERKVAEIDEPPQYKCLAFLTTVVCLMLYIVFFGITIYYFVVVIG